MEKYADHVVSEAFFEQLTSTDQAMNKVAESAVTEFTRKRVREDGFWRKILPPVQVSNSDLTRQVDTDKNVIVVDMEPGSPAAISVPYGTLPMNRYIKGARYRVMFDRILSPRLTKDVSELRNYHMDIRQVLSDNIIKDMLAEEDGKAIRAVNTVLGGADTVLAETGIAQWRTINDQGINRVSWNDALKILPSTPSHLSPSTILLNNVTVIDLQKWGRTEMGDDLAGQIARKGFAETTFFGTKLLVTIKRNLVPDGTTFQFADPKFLGKFFVLEDTTMAIKKEFFLIEFFAYEEIGSAIANVAAVARVDFQGEYANRY